MDKLTFLEIPLFKDLDRVHKAMLLPEFTQKNFPKGSVLFEEGELGDCLYIIMQGKVRIFLDKEEKERTLALLQEKEYFGEMSLLTGDPRSASARAEEDVVVLRLDKEQFDRLLLQHSTLAVQFAGILARRLALVNQKKDSTPDQDEARQAQSSIHAQKEGRIGSSSSINRAEAGQTNTEPRSLYTFGYIVMVLLGSIGVFLGLVQLPIDRDAAIVLSILFAAFLLVAFRLVSLTVTTIAMAVLIVIFHVAALEQVLSAFVEEPIITAIFLAFIAQIIAETGVLQRMLFMLVVRIPEHSRLFETLLCLTGIVTALLIPSTRVRINAAIPIFNKSRDVSALQVYAFLFITSSISCWFTLAFLPEHERGEIGYGDWILSALPLAIAMGIIYFLIGIFEKNKDVSNLDRSVIQAQLNVMGPWSLQEKAACFVMGFMIAGLLVAPRFDVQVLWIVAATCFILVGIVGLNKETGRKIPYADFAVFGLLVGFAGVMDKVGLTGAGKIHVLAGISPFWLLLFLFLCVIFLRLIIPAMLAIMAGMVLFGSYALEAGVQPIVVALVATVAAMAGGNQEYSGNAGGVSRIRHSLVALLALAAVIPVWQAMQLLPEANAIPASKPVFTMQSGMTGNIYLPSDKAMSESMRRGIRLAERTAAEGLELRTVYIEPEENPALQAQQPSFIVSASSVPGVQPEHIPILATNGNKVKKADQGKGNMYVLSVSPEAYARSAFAFLTEHAYDKIAIYYADSDEGRLFASRLEKMAEQQEVTVTDRIVDTHSRLLMQQTLEKWKGFGTKLCVVFDPGGTLAETLIKENRSASFPLPLLVISDKNVLSESTNFAVHWLTDFDIASERKQTRQFIDQYVATYNEMPDRMAAIGYDATMLVLEAARLAGTSDSQALGRELSHIKRWEGAVRTYTITDNEAFRGALKVKTLPYEIRKPEQERGREQ
ncbi:cyclic nucleotide-binding domain-containing protein [Aneurinibacillus aneurinilyticus]|uniref:Cyclic nucleotide-binding domain protein n=1 Tax=Aneurinibacillus aneurinilyticus ATCC 12856 TaxID=649747 RepID=U1XYW5_ANEAE|nr:cyclic nucleotide-binding domain-containing protein [Aneurinibacillus aneurinilyticus]ERI03946.1 cyclic nucleotide-binding domain protein [Aneurinibacillus aneurinilyticus ATCC 12856]MED0705475.1 cyclic nucleotide-binding domain-containing protein [Aneurinibacillus aneurinilyticus]MED0721901.1 cyclic nucleotide-binding domain-containing protein [Aneurinibacillus aneurinilyticus]MED0731509.1 cyclic nucleotide-binding domain-containing protein [Aneurinibacillus aneurinilyticus]MED0743041.1 cy